MRALTSRNTRKEWQQQSTACLYVLCIRICMHRVGMWRYTHTAYNNHIIHLCTLSLALSLYTHQLYLAYSTVSPTGSNIQAQRQHRNIAAFRHIYLGVIFEACLLHKLFHTHADTHTKRRDGHFYIGYQRREEIHQQKKRIVPAIRDRNGPEKKERGLM